MKHLFIILAILAAFWSSNVPEPSPHCTPVRSYSFPNAPDTLTVKNTLHTNGVETLVDTYGNGADMYVLTCIHSLETEIERIRNEFGNAVQEEHTFLNGIAFYLRNADMQTMDPVSRIIVFQKDGYIVQVYLYALGPPETHGRFYTELEAYFLTL